MTFRPMLATRESITEEDVASLSYPLLVSPKLDGWRCIITPEGPVTRAFEPIPNNYVRNKLKLLPIGLDGELIVGPMTGKDVWNRTQSGLSKHDGEPSFVFHVFDDYRHPGAFVGRLNAARCAIAGIPYDLVPVIHLPHTEVHSPHQLADLERHYVYQEFEGMIIRDPAGGYKFGRATRKEATLLKYKRFDHSEALIVGFKEKQRNDNVLETSALGYAKRSKKKEGMVPVGVLGAFECALIDRVDPLGNPITFDLSGFTAKQREEIWANQNNYLRQIARLKHQGFTSDGKPRCPIYEGLRDPRDMS